MAKPAIPGLWTCPKCGRKLVGRNMAHACNDCTVEGFLRNAGSGRALYDKLETMVARCGPYYTSPAKSRITFMARMRFMGVTRVRPDGMTFYFLLPQRLEHPRFARVHEVVPRIWMHTLRVTDRHDLDAQLQRWLRESYRLMGMQERLKR